MTAGTAEPPGPHWVRLALVPVLFYLGAKLSLLAAVMPEVMVVLWIPNGIILTFLLHDEGRHYPLIALSVILAELAADVPTFSLTEAALFGAINVLEVTVAYLLLRRWKFDPEFATPADIAKFIAAGPFLAAFLSACGAATIYTVFRGGATSFGEFLRLWWFSDGLGLLVVTPLVLTFTRPPPLLPDRRLRWYDGVALLVTLAIVVPFALAHQRMFGGVSIRPFLLLPPVLYAAARFSMAGTSSIVVAVAALLLYVTKNGQQPFGSVSLDETVMSVQELLFIIAASSYGMTALLSQHRRYRFELEMRVHERTAALSAANDQLQRLAVTDALTGVANRRALHDLMSREMTRDRRYRHPLALIVFDLDHFKDVNDRYGHAAGDALLQHVARLATSVIRSSDILARYGGEEFVVLAPETPEENAAHLAERLRTALRSTPLTFEQQGIAVTASFGVATLQPDDTAVDAVLRRADAALYAAKAAGRDRVNVA